jgi:hypothetical protein
MTKWSAVVLVTSCFLMDFWFLSGSMQRPTRCHSARHPEFLLLQLSLIFGLISPSHSVLPGKRIPLFNQLHSLRCKYKASASPDRISCSWPRPAQHGHSLEKQHHIITSALRAIHAT